MELSVRALLGSDLQSWISMTSSQVRDEFDATQQARSWDQPLALNGGVSWSGSHTNLSAVLSWHSGWPSTPVAVGDSAGSNPVVLAHETPDDGTTTCPLTQEAAGCIRRSAGN